MKTHWITMLLFATVTTVGAQNIAAATGNTNQNIGNTNQSATVLVQHPIDTPYAVTFSDGNSRVWKRTTYERSRSGQWIPHLRSFTELATGLNHQNPQTGEWLESKDEINIMPDGTAAATNGQYSVYFPANIYSGVIQLVTPDGEVLKSRPMGVSYYDGTNSVLIAELATNSIGQLISSNQVIYTNAFTDFAADLVMTYRKSGFEADLVIRSQPPTPESFGLSSQNCRMELLTEFFSTPEPVQTPTGANPTGLGDTSLQFGVMKMIRGKAFKIGSPDAAVSVSKTWEQMSGRTFLVEAVPVSLIKSKLQSLPLSPASTPIVSAGSVLHKVSSFRLLPPPRLAQLSTNTVRFAKAELDRGPGLVWDYNIVNSQSNLTFRGDTTYYVSGTVNLTGTTVIEGGSVIKEDTNYACNVNILGSVQCQTAPYHPAVFTSVNDASVGEPISSSSPSCTGTVNFTVNNSAGEDLTVYVYDDSYNYVIYSQVVSADTSGSFTFTASPGQHFAFDSYGNSSGLEYYEDFWTTYQYGTMNVYDAYGDISYTESGDVICTPPIVSSTGLSLANGGSLHDLIMRYLGTGIQSSANYSVTNLQFVQCQTEAFEADDVSLYAGNVLISQTPVAFGGQGFAITSEQLTYDQGNQVAYSSGPGSCAATLRNALITGVSTNGNVPFTSNSVVWLNSGNGIYQTAGAGSYYLGTNSQSLGGTTNISPALLAELRQKTVYPPIVYSNVMITTNLELGAQIPRDTNTAPIVGYHYAPLDWCFGGVTANSNVTFDAGTAVGWFETGNNYGIALSNDSTNTFNGTVFSPCVFARYGTVQEGGNGNWTSKSASGGISTVGKASYFAEIDAKFTHCYALAADPNHFRDYYAQLNVHANNSEFYGGSLAGYWLGQFMTNCLYDRLGQDGSQQKSAGLFWRNCTMHGGQVFAVHSSGQYWPVWIENCAFDDTTTDMDDHSNGDTNTYCNFNAFVNGAQPLLVQGSNDVVPTNTFVWQAGPLGAYYQATNSPLIDHGSVTADAVGLCNFTTQTNQTEEGLSTVDIGYHYMALDQYGNILDSDDDCLPDSWELEYFGNLSFSGTNLDCFGNTLLYDFDNGLGALAVPVITLQAVSSTNKVGDTVTFTVLATNNPPVLYQSYQWVCDGTNIPGATSTNLTLSNVQLSSAGSYWVVVSSTGGIIESAVAQLSVVGVSRIIEDGVLPEISGSASIPTNATINLRVIPSGNPPTTNFPPGEPAWALVSGPSLSLPAAGANWGSFTPTAPGRYVISASCGNYSSNTFTLTVVDGTDTDYDGIPDSMELGFGPWQTQLGSWRFDTSDWIGLQEQRPLTYSNLLLVSGWSIGALEINSNGGPAMLAYGDINTNTSVANIDYRQGSIRFWFKPDWKSSSTGGPQQPLSRLVEAGTPGLTGGSWGLYVNSNGTTLSFWTQGSSTNTLTNNLSATIQWTNNWHHVTLTYSITNSTLYLDGQQITNGLGVTNWPSPSVRSNGFRIGTDGNGTNWAQGSFDNFETFNYVLPPAYVTNYFITHSNQPPGETNSCPLAPIAVNLPFVETLAISNIVGATNNGSGSGNSGWLTWNGSQGNTFLVESLTNLYSVTTNYTNPDPNGSNVLYVGGLVWANTGVNNANPVTTALDAYTNSYGATSNKIGVVLWGGANPNHTNYQVSGFATIALISYHLNANANQGSYIQFEYLGARSCDAYNPNQPPTNQIVSPTNNQPFTVWNTNLPATVPIQVAASDPEDGLRSVAYYSSTNPAALGTLLYYQSTTNANTNVFIYVWTNAPHGTNYITTIATDELGATASAIVTNIVNWPPQICAGPNIMTNWPEGATNILLGTVTDDGLPQGIITNIQWSVLSSNGPVTFTNTSTPTTQVSFTTNGTYVFELSASDGAVTGTNTCTIIVRPRPFISITAPTNGAILSYGVPITLNATAYDLDGIVTNVQFFNGTTFIGNAIQVSSNSYTFIWRSAPDAVVSVTAVATDNDGITNSATVSFTINQPPRVNPGPTQIITLPVTNVTIAATVTDDGLPVGNTLTATWSLVSGNGPVSFSDIHATNTTVGFPTNGIYVLQLTANDGVSQSSSNVTVIVNMRPQVSAGTNRIIRLTGSNVTTTLVGTAADDGLPPGAPVTGVWSVFSATNGSVTFANSNSFTTTATFTNSGGYILQLTANDTVSSNSNQVTVIVNRPPTDYAGTNQTLIWVEGQTNISTSLAGTNFDDGYPYGFVTNLWTATGPGSVIFSYPTNTSTSATFSTNGVYSVSLIAGDGDAFSTNTCTISVLRRPFVTIFAPTNNASFSFGLPITNIVSAYDLDSSITNLELFTNGAFLAVATQPSEISVSNKISWWRAESNANDSIDGNNGVITGAVAFASGRVGEAFLFTDTNEDIIIPASSNLNVGLDSGFTLEAWVSPTNVSTYQPIFEWNAGDGVTYWGVHFYIDPYESGGFLPGSVYANIVDSNGGYHRMWTPAGVTTSNVFQHVALTYDKTSGVARIYCNGAIVAQQTFGNFTPKTYQNLHIGRRPTDPGGTRLTFSGMIDEAAIYSRALSQYEIQEIYNARQTVWTNAPAGTNILTALAADNIGLTSTSAPVTIAVLNSSPTVQITAPINQTLLARTTNTISATATNPVTGVPIKWVQFFADSQSIGYAVATNGVFQWPWIPVTGGTHVLTAMAVDTQSNSASSAPVTNTVRNVPSVEITSPTNGEIFLISPTNLAVISTATADEATITNVTFYQGTTPIGTNTSGPFTITWANVTNGTFMLNAKAFDSTGLVGISSNITIIVEPTNQPPRVYAGTNQTVYLFTNWVPLHGIVSDDGLPVGGTLTVNWTNLNGGTNVMFMNSNLPVTSVYFWATGTYTLRLSATDSQFTNSSNMTITVYPSNQPPHVCAGTNQTLVWPAPPGSNFIETIDLTNFLYYPNTLYGVDYFAPSNCLITTVQSIDGSPNFALVFPDGSVTNFSTVSNLNTSVELHIATARSTLGGFKPGEIFCATGTDSQGQDSKIMRIEPDGTTIGTNTWTDSARNIQSNAWMVLTQTNQDGSTNSQLFAALWVDRTGVWGGDLIAVGAVVGGPANGNLAYVWRITSAGKATLVTTLPGGNTFDSVTTIPDDAQKYGPWAGRIVTGGDGHSIFAIDTNGIVTTFDLRIGTESILVIPNSENFFGWNGTGGTLYGAPASDFEGMSGDILAADENPNPSYPWLGGGYLYRLHWNGTNFNIYPLNDVKMGWEPGAFCPMGLSNVPAPGAQLSGVVTDDGEIFSTTSNHWSVINGLGSVQFMDVTLTNTMAEFATTGQYELQLSAYDGQYTSNSDVTITVLQNKPPNVSAGTNQTISTADTTLQGIVTDDGLPYHVTNSQWSVVGGTNSYVHFASATSTNSAVSFDYPGTYVLMLTGDDKQATNFSQVTINVQGPSMTVTPTNMQVNCTNTSVTISATILDVNGSPLVGTNVDFSIPSGPDNSSVTFPPAQTDSNGVASVTYTNTTGPGEDTVQISLDGDPSLTNFVVVDWGLRLDCGDSYIEKQIGNGYQVNHSIEIPGHIADYYFITGQTGQTVNLLLKQVTGPLVMLLRDITTEEVVAESPIQFVQANDVTPLTYTCPHAGQYLVEVAELYENISDDVYDLQLSCSGGPQMSILYNGSVVPNDGTVTFPQTPQGSPTNILLTITNIGGEPFQIIGFGTNGDFVLTNNVLRDTIAVGASTNLGVKFNASSNGVSFGALALVPDSGFPTNYIVYFMGSTFPTSAIPEVQLTYPTNGSTFVDAWNIPYSAIATSGSAAIETVRIVDVTTNGINENSGYNMPLFFDSDGSYTNTYPPYYLGADGDYTIVAIVSDFSGQTNISAPVLIHIVSTINTNITVLPDLVVIANQSNAPNGGTIVFPTTLPGQSTNIMLMISNAGNYPLAITNFSLTGDFLVSSDAANNLVNGTIAAGAATNLLLTFNASAAGTSVGTITMEDNVPGSGVYSTYLIGNAYSPGQGPPSTTNLAPVAVDDEVDVLANSQGNIFTPLTNDFSPNGYPLTIIAATGSEGGTLAIINNGKAISYTPPRGIRSNPDEPADGFYYEISDGHGGTNWATDYIIIDASDIPQPVITSPSDPYSANAGAAVAITATDTNSPNIVAMDFYLGLDLIGVVTNGVNGQYTLNWTNVYDAAMPTTLITAVGIDKFGQFGTSPPLHITVTRPAGGGQLTAALDSFVDASITTPLSPTNVNLIRDGLLTLNGRATNSLGSNVVWQLGVYSSDGTLIRNLTPSSTGPVGTANTPALLLSNCDLTTLRNGVYSLRLTVTGGYEIADTNVTIQLESNLKIGQFSFSQQDLGIPVSGIPLTVTRTYSSLNLDRGDFGYGWTYALADLDVSFDETRENVKDLDGNTFSERTGGGRDVTLTLPNGQRTTFYFSLQQVGTLGTYAALWQAAPGVTATLTPMGDNHLETLAGSVTGDPDLYYWDAAGPGTPMDAYDFPGFYLTNLDGTAYVITRDNLEDHFIDNGGEGTYVQAYGNPHLSLIKTRNGDQTQIGLDAIVYTSTNGATKQVAFQRNSDGLITAISDPISVTNNGLPTIKYDYDSFDNLIAVERLVDRTAGTYVTNSMFTYTNVNFPHYITGIINADGTQVAKNFYDGSGKLIAVEDADGNRTEFVHDPNNDMEIVIDRRGYTNTYVYDLRGNVAVQTNQLGQINTMAYDGNNNKTNQVAYLGNQPYATNQYIYDTNLNLMVMSIDPLGHSNTYAYDKYGEPTNSIDALGYGTTNVYDTQGDLVATTNALGNTTLNSYGGGLLLGSVDADGTLTTNAYDGNDNLIGTAVIDSSWNIVSSNSFTYDDNNNQVTSTVWRRVGGIWTNATTINVYDAMNRVVQTIHPDGGTNSITYDVNGRQQATTDTLGRTTTYDYDSQGRQIATTNADGTTIQSIYDANGNRIGSVDQAGRQTTYVYDALNRVFQTIYPDNTTNTTDYDEVGRVAQTIDARGTVTANTYDVAGRRLAVTNALGTPVQMVSQYAYDADGNQIISTDAASHSTTNVFDALNRQIQVLYADGTTNSTGFDAVGRKVVSTNQDGIVTLFGYDGAGRLISVTNALNEPEQMVTQYQYDEAGNEVAQIDALGRINTFAYDGMNRRISHTRPDRYTEWFVYDTTGSLVYHTNFDAARIIFNQYDSMNRLTNRTQMGLLSDSFTYTATGQRATMYLSDSSFDCTYDYDNRDRLVRKTSMWSGINGGGPLTVSLGYGYDCNGNLTNLASSMANGVNLSYAYDPLNRITNVLSHGQLTAGYAFDAVGNLQTLKYGNGVTNQYQYDALNRLTNLVWTTNGNMAAKFYYRLGKTGNRTNLSEIVNQTTRTNSWQYDNLYRLTQEIINDSTGSNYLQYQYDAVGNRMNRTSSIPVILPPASYQYDTNDWLTTDEYDNRQLGDGNTTLSGTNSYSYDWLNRMIVGNGITFVYDGDGNKIAKTAQAVGGSVIYYLVDDRNPTGYPQVLEEYVTVSENGTSAALLNRSYNYGLSLISQQQYDINTLRPNVLSYYGFDGHGSVRFLTDTNGAITDSYTYDAYGTLISPSSSTPNNYLYTGQQFDPDIGLYYLRARYYKTETGRFWTSDSFNGNTSDPASLHKYLYGADNPVNNIDPSGHDLIDIAIDIIDPEFGAGKALTGKAVNGPPTHVGDILDEFFSPASEEKLWVMGPDDHYTKIVRQWQPLIDAVNEAKSDFRGHTADWLANHTTTASWTPGKSYATDPHAWHKFIGSPPGTDPDTAKWYFSVWKATGIQADGLYTSSIGSFDIYVTLDNPSTMKVWMFNLMSKHSFGKFAKYAPLSGMANQWMWWDWTEDPNH